VGSQADVVMSFASKVQLGFVTSAGGLGLMLGSILMTASGRGIGLLLVLAGLLPLAAGVVGYLSAAVRGVEGTAPAAESGTNNPQDHLVELGGRLVGMAVGRAAPSRSS
jgi:hypothetical protein